MKKRKKKQQDVSFGFVLLALFAITVVVTVVSMSACEGGEINSSKGENLSSKNEEKSEIISKEDVSLEISREESSSNDISFEEESEEVSHVISEKPVYGEMYADVPWFISENGKRYDEYGEKNPNFTKEQVVTYVNIGLDGDYYTNTYKAKKEDGNFILVNKYSYVDRNFTPDNLVELDPSCKVSGKSVRLVKEAADAFLRLSQDAAALEYDIIGMSGYRTYAYQENLYNNYLKNDTKENVDRYSARPGYSEHHTGLALDVQTKTTSFSNFGQTKEYEWLLDNAHRYGFVIHYTTENQWITGYMPEEWHIRYLGVEAATYIYDNNLSVDEYLVMFGANGPQAQG